MTYQIGRPNQIATWDGPSSFTSTLTTRLVEVLTGVRKLRYTSLSILLGSIVGLIPHYRNPFFQDQ